MTLKTRRRLQVPKVPNTLVRTHEERLFLEAVKNNLDAQQASSTTAKEARPTLEEFESVDLKVKSVRSVDPWVWDELSHSNDEMHPTGTTSWNTGERVYILSSGSTGGLDVTRKLPNYWIEGSDVNVHFHWCPFTALGGNVRMQVAYRWFNPTEVPDSSFSSWTTSILAAPTTTLQGVVTDLLELSGTDKERNSFVQIKLQRTGGDAADTYAGAIGVWAIDIMYKRRAELPRGLGARSIYYQ